MYSRMFTAVIKPIKQGPSREKFKFKHRQKDGWTDRQRDGEKRAIVEPHLRS